MAASDVSITQDGGQGNVKLHPYLITLVRWCVSCLWSTASVLLHRLITTPLPPITAKPAAPSKARQASSEHLHPEPRVTCALLHTPSPPSAHTLDVIFVHGLYGSLGNTWRQGEWKAKYKLSPTKVPLRNHNTSPCSCTKHQSDYNNLPNIYAYETNLNESNLNETNLNEKVTFNQFNGCFKKILPNENSLITENFYNNTLIDVNNYETQAKFVTQLFKNECDKNCDFNNKCSYNVNESSKHCKCNLNETCKINECTCKLNETNKINECKCKLNELKEDCEVGCGCVCDDCYSPCWPKDWIKEDFPGARVISINYTSDPYLWRPLWVKGNKRLRLHERAEQMMSQLLALGVGERPVVWVGHSKGGLFIKQIYCEAYEAHLKMKKTNFNQNQTTSNNTEDQNNRQYNTNNNNNNNLGIKCNNFRENYNIEHKDTNNFKEYNGFTKNNETMRSIDEMKEIRNNNNSGGRNIDNNYDLENNSTEEPCGCTDSDTVLNNRCVLSVVNEEQNNLEDNSSEGNNEVSSSHEEDMCSLSGRASLWRSSAGFMFYSVPHRGSPLADIKTPITSRSVELLEIAKDCPLVLELQRRWLAAAAGAEGGRPAVRSLVETCKTLMSVLWLRIVSVDSADAGIGSLQGVSVDHREICKPSSRRCLLYTELTDLIRAALSKCDCQ